VLYSFKGIVVSVVYGGLLVMLLTSNRGHQSLVRSYLLSVCANLLTTSEYVCRLSRWSMV
jgi:hypothetical protein